MSDVFRAAYRELSEAEKTTLANVKAKAQELYDMLAPMASREGSLAKTALEESVMWAVKHLTAPVEPASSDTAAAPTSTGQNGHVTGPNVSTENTANTEAPAAPVAPAAAA